MNTKITAGFMAAIFALGAMGTSSTVLANTVSSTVVSRKQVTVDGIILSNPYSRVADNTMHMPIWYVGQALEAISGITQTWNGNTHSWYINVPSDFFKIDFSNIPFGTGNTTIYANGTPVKKVNTFAAPDPASGYQQSTVYMPIYYIQQILDTIGISNSWNGHNWQINYEPTSDAPEFSPEINVAMKYVQQHSNMRYLFAPTYPTYNPFVDNSYPYLTASVSANNAGYQVDLIQTAQPASMNDSNTIDSNGVLSGFAGQVYSSDTAAQTQLSQDPTFPDAGTSVNLGDGIIGKESSQQSQFGPMTNIVWHEGKWTLEVFDGTAQSVLSEAKSIINYLSTQYLPMTSGVANIDLRGVTQLQWVFGNTVYSCGTGDAMQAIKMAVSMREYPTYRVIP